MSDEILEGIITNVVCPNALEVDVDGRFPVEAITALGEAGYLGLISAKEVGGQGGGLREAAEVIEQLAGACGSTAMIVLMHYAGTIALEAYGAKDLRESIASGKHLTTLAFSEAGSRSHFWAPLGTATAAGDEVRLDAKKSWVTSAAQADSYVWSSRPLSGDAPMTLWSVPRETPGISPSPAFDGFGLRGNGSTPVNAEGAMIPAGAILGADGAGLDIALTVILPWFLVLSGAFSLGLMEATVSKTAAHLRTTRLEHLGQTLIEQPVTRRDFAQMRVTTDTARTFLNDTLSALETSRGDAMLRVLEVKIVTGESSIGVTELAMKVSGGAGFRKEVGVERQFRDARASRVMAPTTDALLDFVGRAAGGLPLLG
jgi:isovaleryl-CoA dehydrogenase